MEAYEAGELTGRYIAPIVVGLIIYKIVEEHLKKRKKANSNTTPS